MKIQGPKCLGSNVFTWHDRVISQEGDLWNEELKEGGTKKRKKESVPTDIYWYVKSLSTRNK